MKRENTGKYVVISTIGEKVNAYIPAALPPHPLPELSATGNKLLMRAVQTLGALDALGEYLPDVAPFIYAYICKEAVYSSMIEGTQSSLSDLLLYEQGGYDQSNTDDVEEVSPLCIRHAIRHVSHARWIPHFLTFDKGIAC